MKKYLLFKSPLVFRQIFSLKWITWSVLCIYLPKTNILLKLIARAFTTSSERTFLYVLSANILAICFSLFNIVRATASLKTKFKRQPNWFSLSFQHSNMFLNFPIKKKLKNYVSSSCWETSISQVSWKPTIPCPPRRSHSFLQSTWCCTASLWHVTHSKNPTWPPVSDRLTGTSCGSVPQIYVLGVIIHDYEATSPY